MESGRFFSYTQSLAIFLASTASILAAPTHKQPNIVFILADDLGFNDIGYSPLTDVKTPHLDRLANDGLKFNYSYTPFVCSPSRAAILSGKYPFRYGLQRSAYVDLAPDGLDLSLTLLPEQLRANGYRTHMIGKWHLGYCKVEFTPLARGFGSFHGFLGGGIGYYDHLNECTQLLDYWNGTEPLRHTKYSTSDFQDEVVKLIHTSKADHKPMFLYLPIQSVHAPVEYPPLMVKDLSIGRRAIFREMVKTADDFTGAVVQALKDNDMWDNTILIFTSDNGGQPALGGNNLPLRGAKHTLYEGGMRVRSFISGRDVPRGQTYTGLFHAVDWMPTILSMTGAAVTDLNLDGVDQWPALMANAARLNDQPRKSFMYNIDSVTHFSGFVEQRSGVRYRFTDKHGDLKDFKMILGNAGEYSGRYNLEDSDKIKKFQLSSGWYIPDIGGRLFFDMNTDDGILENYPGISVQDDLIDEMENLILAEKKKGYKEVPDVELSFMALDMKDSSGNRIQAPGWC